MFTLYGCGSREYTISFETGNDTSVVPITTRKSQSVRMPIPVHPTDHFVGWFEDEDFTKHVFRSTDVSSNTTLYAKWMTPSDFFYGQYFNRHNPVVAIEIKNYGTILVELFPEHAPNTVRNFIYLVEQGYYDGVPFHRVVEDFVIQAGDGERRDCRIRGEFLANGIINPLPHVRGAISMARVGGLNNSASTQFFIMHQTVQHLNHNYAGFGIMTHGFDVLDAIATSDTGSGEVPLEAIVIDTIRIDRKGISYDPPICVN